MKKIKISAVSYTNTLPFIHGLNHHPELLKEIDLSLDVPSECARKLTENQVDIGLVPVAALLDIPGWRLVSDFCIGSVGKVTSVFIFSKKPIEQIQTLRLDTQSRTSNNLARVLLQQYWNKPVKILTAAQQEADAYVEIGDRTFGKEKRVAYAYDLCQARTDFTGLPFAYAVWAANKEIPEDFMHRLNGALRWGLDQRDSFLQHIPEYKDIDIREYLMNSINYDLNGEKKQAIELFHGYIKQLSPLDAQNALS